jgi:multiple sugar transport system permease protein
VKGFAAKREARAGFLFASPWFLGFTLFMAYPLIASIYFSFCDYSVLKSPVWVGLDNYVSLFHDDVFWMSLINTAVYAVMALPLGMLSALILAMLLNAKVPGLPIYRTLFFLPSLVPQISMAVLWMWVLNGEHGILNNLLAHVGIKGPDWMSNPLWTKPSLVLIAIWGVGNTMIIFLASLQDVPTSLLEAAELDGANGWLKTLNVTLPMISPVILFNLIMGIIGSLQVFGIPFVMFPNGAPSHATYFYTVYLYDNAFRYHKMGYACAMGWIMFVMIVILTFASLKLSEKHVHYQGN